MLRLRTGLPGAVPGEPAAAGGTGWGQGSSKGSGSMWPGAGSEVKPRMLCPAAVPRARRSHFVGAVF